MTAYHSFLHLIIEFFGHRFGETTPDWLHHIAHIVLFWGPLALIMVLLFWIVRTGIPFLRRQILTTRERPVAAKGGLPKSAFGFVMKYSPKQQLILICFGIAAMPILYGTLELPKRIVNNAIDSHHFPTDFFGHSLSQVQLLLFLTSIYLFFLLLNGAVKYVINVYKGRVGETLLRRLRITIYGRWRSTPGSGNRAEVIPIVAQEVEPIGGYAADALALPVFQGGTFMTIIFFMFMQDPLLGAAALTLLPVQLVVIPRLQRRINELARTRVREVRTLSGRLGDQITPDSKSRGVTNVSRSIKSLLSIRLQLHRSKYFMKALNNFLTSLTPVFFYMIGGYLVIQDKLSLGALIAVLAAYKDFSAPLKELFRFYQVFEDVRIRYDEINSYLDTFSKRPA